MDINNPNFVKNSASTNFNTLTSSISDQFIVFPLTTDIYSNDSIVPEKKQRHKRKSPFSFHSDLILMGESYSKHGVFLSAAPSPYANLECHPQLGIFGLPIAANVLMKFEPLHKWNDNTSVTFNFDPATLKQSIENRNEEMISKLIESSENEIKSRVEAKMQSAIEK
jgi:hypothetical protein